MYECIIGKTKCKINMTVDPRQEHAGMTASVIDLLRSLKIIKAGFNTPG
jgi:hypothetical protein